MIDRATFTREFTLLLERFGRDPHQLLTARYFEYLDAHLTTQQFTTAAQIIFESDQFWPAPVRFLAAVNLDASSEAEAAWELALDEAKKGIAQPLDAYDPAHAAALKIVGKNRAIGMTAEDRLPFLKREFISAFKQHRERGSLPELNKPEPVTLPAAASITRRIS